LKMSASAAANSQRESSLDEAQLGALKEDINYWSLKSSDLCLELETLKGEVELESDSIDEEYERLRKELMSVEASLGRMRSQNASLKQEI